MSRSVTCSAREPARPGGVRAAQWRPARGRYQGSVRRRLPLPKLLVRAHHRAPERRLTEAPEPDVDLRPHRRWARRKQVPSWPRGRDQGQPCASLNQPGRRHHRFCDSRCCCTPSVAACRICVPPERFVACEPPPPHQLQKHRGQEKACAPLLSLRTLVPPGRSSTAQQH